MNDTAAVRTNLIQDGIKYGAMLAEKVMDESGRKALMGDPNAVAKIIAEAITGIEKKLRDGGVPPADVQALGAAAMRSYKYNSKRLAKGFS
jgi:hypothetical protein